MLTAVVMLAGPALASTPLLVASRYTCGESCLAPCPLRDEQPAIELKKQRRGGSANPQ
jgi:hypothetical protein